MKGYRMREEERRKLKEMRGLLGSWGQDVNA
jgi:hypothetical protein